MRLVVTGSSGDLGRAFLARVPAHHDVHAFDHAALDVGDHDAVRQVVEPLGPDAILNFAAFTRVDENESDQARAFRDNALGPQHLALAARAIGSVLVHISTDYVFDGEKRTPYDETDVPSPLSVYGRAKLAGERFVREIAPESFVVRVGYVYGGGNDYLSRTVRRLVSGETVGGLADRWGSPTFVGHLAERILPLVATGRFGLYHLGGPQPASWFEVLSRVQELAGSVGSVEPQRAAELGLPAPRPVSSALTSVFTPHLGIDPMPSLEEGLKDFLADALS
ncbi:MAG: dTDP-4-dehydrorhamnose reductase [Actinomycetota bacterium]|nr:dTDP-4-dehydrorhamnose reductase [Actinomycetota bacterium]MDH5224021.1 dTDP-4-dehydrorhamnose reductase [Actinomycetota bacterium]MDH5313907.1 dTDP-4-dehydrorhamnose reductase [Actinomycetota bacterium]